MSWRDDIENWLDWAGDQKAAFDNEETWRLLADVIEWEDALRWLDRQTARGMAQPECFRGRYS